MGSVRWAFSPLLVQLVGKGVNRKGIWVSVKAPFSLLDANSFRGCGERAPPNILAGYMC